MQQASVWRAVGEHVGNTNGYLAGTDAERAADLNRMFADPEVQAVFCSRGGYGSVRLLPHLDFNQITKNRKILVGYSDITALQMSIFKKTGLITFAGPMLATDFSGSINKFTEENFWKILTSNKKIGRVYNPREENYYILTKGRGEGKILG